MLAGHPLDHLIQEVFLEERQGLTQFTHGHYTLKWEIDNVLDLVFVAIYPNIMTVLNVDKTVAAVRAAFVKRHAAELKDRMYKTSYPKFDVTYRTIAAEAGHLFLPAAAAAAAGATTTNAAAPATATAAEAALSSLSLATKPDTKTAPAPAPGGASAGAGAGSESVSPPASPSSGLSEEVRLAKIKALNDRLAAAAAAKKAGNNNNNIKGGKTPSTPNAASAAADIGSGKKAAPKKVATKWDDTPLSRVEASALDMNSDSGATAAEKAEAARYVS